MFSDRRASVDKVKDGGLSKQLTFIQNLKDEEVVMQRTRGRASLTERTACAKALRWKELVMAKTKKVKEAGRALVSNSKETGFYPKGSGGLLKGLSRGHMRG